MSYEVRCECGKAYPVGAADAGVSFPCGCGKTVEVPPLHRLRSAGGEVAVPILVRVRNLIANGLLPGPRVCALCSQPTRGMARVGLGCEPTPGEPDVRTGQALGCFFGFLLGSPFGIVEAATAEAIRRESPDLSLVVPLPVCGQCRPRLSETTALKHALGHIPDYADLLERYPDALLVLMK